MISPALSSPSRSLALALAACTLPAFGAAQVRGEWNLPRVMDLVQQARDLRGEAAVDPSFRAYSAQARGFVYFFLDRPDAAERTLVKTDQLALEVYWRAPRQTKQRIVGRRDRKELPTTINYHIDHLTVVQDDFGDEIRMGAGDEVRAVTHPAAPRSAAHYDFRLADSLTITLPGGPIPEIRVYEIQVRPKNFDRPGVIGTIFLERETGAIVRMGFTFTPASYVDKHLDYIRISLDNMAWDGKFWLPYRQQVEIRRELPVLEFLAGSVIRGRFEIGDYTINPELPAGLFRGPRVTAVSNTDLEDFPFEEELLARIDEEGLGEIADLESIQEQAYEVIGRRYLSGLRPSRLYVPRVSSITRHNRAEGLYAGGGLSFQPSARSRVKITGGYAFGREAASVMVEVSRKPAIAGPSLRVTLNRLNDLGPVPGASGAVNTLGSVVGTSDYLDAFFTSGLSLGQRWSLGARSELDVSLDWQRVRSASNVISDDPDGYRPVLSVTEGDGLVARVGYNRHFSNVQARFSVAGGRFDGDEYVTASAQLGWEKRFAARSTVVAGSIKGTTISQGAPSHEYLLLGGRHSLPGHDYRSFVGDQLLLLRAEVSQPVFAPWLYIRVFGAAGATGLDGSAPTGWTARTTEGLATSAGVGVAVGWDVLRLDLGRGLSHDGDWELVFSAHKRFWPWL